MAAFAERVRRRGSECAVVAAHLPAYVAGEADLDDRDVRHLSQCLRCQADEARYRRMLRTLHALRRDPAGQTPGVLAGALTVLDDGGRRHLPGPWEAWVAIGVAAVAGGAGAFGVIWCSRHRGTALA